MPSRRCSLAIFAVLITTVPLAKNAGGAEPAPSAMLMGPIGLNTVPSSRMDKAGTMRAGAGGINPYLHSFAGFQISDSLYVGVRQTAQKSAWSSQPERLYPALDLKVKLSEEGRYMPEIAAGVMSGYGHKKTASEYIAFSKRFKDFDFTLGMGWGRLAGKGHFSNPMKAGSDHFDRERDFNSELPATQHDWFTGDKAGLFAGLEYRLPIEGLSLKADWGANPYTIEENDIPGFEAPASWSLGLNYQPVSWVSGMIGLAGTDTVMARLSLQNNVADWKGVPQSAPASGEPSVPAYKTSKPVWRFNLALKNDFSLSEEDSDLLYRTGIIARQRLHLPFGFYGGGDVKYNLSDNLETVTALRWPAVDPVRSDVDQYTARRFYLDRAYGGWRGALLNGVYLSLSGGMLEEMYKGYGGEILFRPPGYNFAIGAEGWQVYKRDSGGFLGNEDLNGPRFTGHVNFFYHIPQTDLTAYLKAGRYLGKDKGASVGVDHTFRNGVTLGGFFTASREYDYDAFGGATHFYSGLQMKVPLGGMPYVPGGSEAITTFHPMGRDAGQMLDKPEPLYEATEPVSYRSASRNWDRLLD